MTEQENLRRIELIKLSLAGAKLSREELAELADLQAKADVIIESL